MKHLKILGLAAVAAMALMAFAASSASATALYNGATKLNAGSTIDFSLKSGTKAKLVNTAETETLDECSTSTAKGKTTNNGGKEEEFVEGELEELTWGTCTVPTTTDVKGGLKVKWTSGTNGEVFSNKEIGVTVNTIFFGVCRYGVTAGTKLGTLATSATETAAFTANAIASKQAGSETVCPTTARWTGNYVSTTPDNLRVEES